MEFCEMFDPVNKYVSEAFIFQSRKCARKDRNYGRTDLKKKQTEEEFSALAFYGSSSQTVRRRQRSSATSSPSVLWPSATRQTGYENDDVGNSLLQ